MTKLILHIGGFRTGSTSTQTAFWSSRRLLRRQGILYPETGLVIRAHHGLGLGVLGRGIDGLYPAPQCENILDSLAREVESSGCDTVLVSTELFMLLLDDTFPTEGFEERFRRFLSLFDEVRVLCVVRHQAPLLESSYRFEVLRHDNRGRPVRECFKDYVCRWMEKPLLEYVAVEQFLHCIRPDIDFDFISYATAIRSGALVRHVYQRAGIAKAYRGEIWVNESQSRLGTLAVLLRNQRLLSHSLDRDAFLRWTKRRFPDRRDSLFDARLLEMLTTKYHASNEWFADRFEIQVNDELASFRETRRLAGPSLSQDELQHVNTTFRHRSHHPLIGSLLDFLGVAP